MNLENYFISKMKNRHIGDDGALIAHTLYSNDAFLQNVHFKVEWMSHYEIARKAMLVNISDAVAMNAIPKYALLSIAMPKSTTKTQVDELVAGFNSVCQEYGVEIIGGDTVANSKLDISISIIATSKKPLFRKGIKGGDFLAHTGELGASKRDLQRLLNGGKVHKKSKFVSIKLRGEFIQRVRRDLHAGMDISDGLFADLEKLSQVNNMSFTQMQKISKEIACSGEEYEMLIAFSPRSLKRVQRLAKRSRVALNVFAQARRGRFKSPCKAHHF